MTSQPVANKPASGDGAAKRKRNRNKKKSGKNKEAGDATPAPSTGKSGGGDEEARMERLQSKLNPHAVLRNDLMNQGYSEEQVDVAMEEMWNKQLPYDEYEAVLKYLETGGKCFEDQATKNEAKKPTKEVVKSSEKTISSEKNDNLSGGEEQVKETVQASTLPEQAQPMTMAAKLDMVAGYENMTDAAFALTEWVSKAAKPHEVSKTYRSATVCVVGLYWLSPPLPSVAATKTFGPTICALSLRNSVRPRKLLPFLQSSVDPSQRVKINLDLKVWSCRQCFD